MRPVWAIERDLPCSNFLVGDPARGTLNGQDATRNPARVRPAATDPEAFERTSAACEGAGPPPAADPPVHASSPPTKRGSTLCPLRPHQPSRETSARAMSE